MPKEQNIVVSRGDTPEKTTSTGRFTGVEHRRAATASRMLAQCRMSSKPFPQYLTKEISQTGPLNDEDRNSRRESIVGGDASHQLKLTHARWR
jgi:hypothetical protein